MAVPQVCHSMRTTELEPQQSSKNVTVPMQNAAMNQIQACITSCTWLLNHVLFNLAIANKLFFKLFFTIITLAGQWPALLVHAPLLDSVRQYTLHPDNSANTLTASSFGIICYHRRAKRLSQVSQLRVLRSRLHCPKELHL